MKISLKSLTGIGLMLIITTGTGFGQEAAKVVEGYQINPTKAGKAGRAAKTERVTGVAVQDAVPLASTPGEAITVTGVSMHQQEKVSTQRKAVLTFKGESKPSEVKVKVDDNEGYLKIMIQSSFRSGSIAVELIDPKGESRGKYTLKTDDPIVTGDKTSVTEEVSGDMQKDFVNPLKGEWIIRAIPVTAEGTINVMILQESFPGLHKAEAVEVIGYPIPQIKR